MTAPEGSGQGTPRLLHCIANPGVGGMERVIELLAGAQQARGRDIQVAAFVDPRRPLPPLPDVLAAAGVTAHVRPMLPRSYGAARRGIRDLCRQLGARVLHTHGYQADVLGAAAAGAAGVVQVSTVHGFTGGDLKNRIYERVQVLALRRCRGVAAVSRPLAAELRRRGVANARLHMVPNAWRARSDALARADARAALALPASPFVIGFVGRLSAEKGADVFVDALGKLGGVAWTAAVVGEGRERAGLEQRAAALGVGERLAWRGGVTGAGRLMTAFDVLVLASRTEGTPMVLFEAMEAGVPVVATAVGGVPDVVGPATARLVAPEDPAALAVAIDEVRRDPAGAASRAAAARARLHSAFAEGAWVEAYDAVYAAALAGSGR